MMFSWVGLTPLGAAEVIGGFLVVVTVWQLYQARHNGGRWSLDDD